MITAPSISSGLGALALAGNSEKLKKMVFLAGGSKKKMPRGQDTE